MSSVDPQIVIRLGTHAEKDYLHKTAALLDGVMVAANLVEATPGATASMLIKYGGKVFDKAYFLDPMTYAYGQDLDMLKSERKVKKKTIIDFKRSYKNLAETYGGVFAQALDKDKALPPKVIRKHAFEVCESVANYQMTRIASELDGDSEFTDFANSVPPPTAVLSPYFYVDPHNPKPWLDLIPILASKTVEVCGEQACHAVVLADQSLLDDATALSFLNKELPLTGVSGVWFWFSNLDELTASTERLRALRSLVTQLSKKMEVNNLHGGYFSLALSRFGMSRVSHGIGYGERKDVVPAQGGATPMVRYYLPDLRKRLGVPDIVRTFNSLGISTASDFHKQVCDCVVCRGVVKTNLSEFDAFGDLHFASTSSKRKSQTPAAAKRCRFHFLINRIREREAIKSQSIDEIQALLSSAYAKWGPQPSIGNDASHLARWRDAMADD